MPAQKVPRRKSIGYNNFTAQNPPRSGLLEPADASRVADRGECKWSITIGHLGDPYRYVVDRVSRPDELQAMMTVNFNLWHFASYAGRVAMPKSERTLICTYLRSSD